LGGLKVNYLQAESLYQKVLDILAKVDCRAKEICGEEQGWDNQIQVAWGVPVLVKHTARQHIQWCEPIGWEPESFPGASELEYDDGALWSESGEEFGIATDDSGKLGLVQDIFWLQSGTSELKYCGEVDAGSSWKVRVEIDSFGQDFSPEWGEEKIEKALEGYFPCFAD
jgi:hypothetical protein